MDDSYVRYARFYEAVMRQGHVDMPSGYRQNVRHVLKASGLPDRPAQIAMRRFGIVDCCEPETVLEIAVGLNEPEQYVRDMVDIVLDECRKRLNLDVLLHGLER